MQAVFVSRPSPSLARIIIRLAVVVCSFGSLAATTAADDVWTYEEIDWDNDVEYVPFSVMQAVDTSGNPIWPAIPTLPGYEGQPQAYKLRGVVLNDPAKMLNTAANYVLNEPWVIGGQWQVYIQAVDASLDPGQPAILAGDHGGAALWMGQNYGNMKGYWGGVFMPEYSYPNDGYYSGDEWVPGWNDEVARLNTARGTLVEPLRPGDLIEVRARGGLKNAGKFNCNEQHQNDVTLDFDIVVVDRDLPLLPQTLALNEIIDGAGGFRVDDASNLPVAEAYQSQYVRLEGVRVASVANWNTYGEITVTDDGVGEFKVKLGYNTAFDGAFDIEALAVAGVEIDITGVFDQEDSAAPFLDGYRLWALSPADFAPAVALTPGDATADGAVDAADAACLAQHWGDAGDASWFDGDFNGDRRIDAADAAIMAANWGAQSPERIAAPEPSVLVLLLTACCIGGRRTRRDEHQPFSGRVCPP